MSLIYLDLERPDDALTTVQNALKMTPDDMDLNVQLAEMYTHTDDQEAAERVYKDIFDKAPNSVAADADFHYNYGLILLDLGKFEEALGAFENAVQIAPDDAENHNQVAIALDQLERYDEAYDTYQKAIQLEPLAAVYHNLGVNRSRVGKTEEAISAYRQSLALDPNRALTHINLGMQYRKASRETDALQEFEEALRLEPDNEDAHYEISVPGVMR